MEKVELGGLRRNGVKISYDADNLQMSVDSVADSVPSTIPIQLAVTREGI